MILRHFPLLTPSLVLIVSQLHLLRNVTILYFFVYLVVLCIAAWSVLANWTLLTHKEKFIIKFILLLFLFPIFSFVPGIISGRYSGVEDIAIGAARVLFSLPIYLAILAASNTKRTVTGLVMIAAIITSIAALSVPYQFLFGPVEWFAESSERAGIERFASLFGSLTALGIACGYGISAAALSFASVTWLSLLVASIIIGSILSLQKAAIVNIVLAIVTLPLVRTIKARQLFLLLGFFIVFLALAGQLFREEISGFVSTLRFYSEVDDEQGFTDESIAESMISRLVYLPGLAISSVGAESLLFGLGPIGGGGQFGYRGIYNAHNGIVDLLLVGGVPYLVFFSLFIAYVYKISRGKIHCGRYKRYALFGSLTLFLVFMNLTFSGLIFFSKYCDVCRNFTQRNLVEYFL